ncbi:MAG: type II secretion system protein GspE, partial [Desulfobacteraceae bacterium]|nr:type II secretion system protein GspE [Desulfobacteraceae bacterium]
MRHRRIGEILLETSRLTGQGLEDGLKIQEEKGGRIGEILIRQGAVTEAELLNALGIQFNLPVLTTLPARDIDTSFAEEIPIQFLRKHRMAPVVSSSGANLAINDPLLFQPLDDLRLLTGLKEAEVVLAPYGSILSFINFAYDMSRDSAEQVIEDMHGEETSQILSEIEEAGDLLEDTSDAPVVRLVNLML